MTNIAWLFKKIRNLLIFEKGRFSTLIIWKTVGNKCDCYDCQIIKKKTSNNFFSYSNIIKLVCRPEHAEIFTTE